MCVYKTQLFAATDVAFFQKKYRLQCLVHEKKYVLKTDLMVDTNIEMHFVEK